jgi:ADP-heptose:LPS heptosyltransferase
LSRESLENQTPPARRLLSELPLGSRVLILRLRSIGDIVLLTPALRLLKNWRPDLRLSVMVESRFRELLQGNPTVDEILVPGEGTGIAKLAARLATTRELRRRKFALCVNLHGGPTSRMMTRWCGAPWRAGFHHHRGAQVYNVIIPDALTILKKPSLHTAEHQAAAFFYLGLPITEIPRAEIYFRREDSDWWAVKRAELGIGAEQPYAILHPTAAYQTKQWAPEGFARLGKYLENQAGISVVYTCGPGESGVIDAVEQAAGAPVRRLQGMSLGRFAAALASARLLIGNDSGPAHLAAALSRNLIVIFGSSSSPIWGPWQPQATHPELSVVQNPFECNPCPGDHCYKFSQPECILSITFEQVKTAVDKVLAQTQTGG